MEGGKFEDGKPLIGDPFMDALIVLMEAKDDARQAEVGRDMARVKSDIEHRMFQNFLWLVGIIVGSIAAATAIIIQVLS